MSMIGISMLSIGSEFPKAKNQPNAGMLKAVRLRLEILGRDLLD